MKSIREYWNLLATYLKPQRSQVLGLTLVLALGIGLQLFTPRVLRDFIDLALANGSYAMLFQKALLFFGMVLTTQLTNTLATYLSERVAWTATNLLRVDLAGHCLRLDMPFHQNNPPGALIERVEGDVDALSNFFSQFIVRILANAVLVLGVLALLYREDWRAGLGLTLFTALAIFAMLRVRQVGVPRWVAVRQKTAEAFGFLGEVLHGTEDIRANGAVGYIRERFQKLLREWFPLRRSASLAFGLIWTTTLLLFTFGTGFAFGLGYLLWSAGAITAGTVYLIYNYTELIRQPIEQIRAQMEDLQRASASITRVRELFAMQPGIQDGNQSLPASGALQVEFDGVSFNYAGQNAALEELSFKLPAGQVLGLLGRTGSGKSTLARLLLRLYDPAAGQILLGGVPTSASNLADLTRRVGLVPQEVQVFGASLRNNLSLFDPSISDESIMAAIEAFELSGWFRSLPRGLDTELGQSVGLSAGQAQLLNFARVALRDPGLVILDEATSRLDLATEALLERATARLLSGRSGIIIAHRLHTVQKADLIMILEDGRLREFGARQELQQDAGSRFSGLLRTGLEELLA
jgi:ABC-type multidrug transport system fused ATPase/permease subunit